MSSCCALNVQKLDAIRPLSIDSKYLTFQVLNLDMVEVAGSSPVVPTNLLRNNHKLRMVKGREKLSVLDLYGCFWKILEGAGCAKNVQWLLNGLFGLLSAGFINLKSSVIQKQVLKIQGPAMLFRRGHKSMECPMGAISMLPQIYIESRGVMGNDFGHNK